MKGDKLVKVRDAGLKKGVRAGNKVGVGGSEEESDRFDRNGVRVDDWRARRRAERIAGALHTGGLLSEQILIVFLVVGKPGSKKEMRLTNGGAIACLWAACPEECGLRDRTSAALVRAVFADDASEPSSTGSDLLAGRFLDEVASSTSSPSARRMFSLRISGSQAAFFSRRGSGA